MSAASTKSVSLLTVSQSLARALSRRTLLGGAALTTVAGLSAGVLDAPAALGVAAAATPIDAVSENAGLVALGEQIDPLLSAYRAAAERRRAARDLAEELCPRLPDDLVCKREDRVTFAGVTARERDVEDSEVWVVGGDGFHNAPPREIIQATPLAEAVANGRIYPSPRTKLGKRVRKLIEIAKKYETEREVAIARSGLREALRELHPTVFDLEQLARNVRKIEPTAMVGVMI